MRQISISTSFDYAIPIDMQIPMIKEAGFYHVSIGGNYEHSGILDESGIADFERLITKNELSVDTIHGYNLDKSDSIEVNKRIVNAAKYLKVPVIVVHCSSFTFKAETLEDRRKDISSKISNLEQISKETGIKFAIENVLPGVATDFAESIIKNADPEYIGFCYDSSHDQVGGPKPFDLLERLKERLFAVHISDRIKEFVDHVIPGEGFVDFNEMCNIIKGSPFRAPFLIEVMTTNSNYKDTKGFLKLAYEKSTELYDKIYC